MIRITNFQGMIPALDPKQLPNEAASFARNCKLDNGTLRPFVKPTPVQGGQPAEPAYDTLDNFIYFGGTNSKYPILARLLQQNAYDYFIAQYPYDLNPRIIYIDNQNVLRAIPLGSNTVKNIGVPVGPSIAFNGLIPQNRSKYPLAQCYCATYVNEYGEEGAPGTPSALFTGNEGDIVSLIITPLFSGVISYGIRKIRLYKTMTPYSTGEELTVKTETNYHLVAEIDASDVTFEYIVDTPTSRTPNDLLLSKEFFQPPIVNCVGLAYLSDGFVVIAYLNGTIRISERFTYHAFPLRNQITLPEYIDSIVANKNSIYVTCKNGAPYKITVTPDPSGIKVITQQYPDFYYSKNPRSLTKTNFGSLYSSQRGLVGLSDSQIVMTNGYILADQWNRDYNPTKSFWLSGFYIGVGGPTYNMLVDIPDSIGGTNSFRKLTTLDDEILVSNIDNNYYMVQASDGIYINTNLGLYKWVGLEDNWTGLGHDVLARYLWRSKTYVFPGRKTFAAAKVTFADGTCGETPLTFRIYADGALRYERLVHTDQPFRLPHLFKAMNWYIELEGKSTVHEVHVAESMTDLKGATNGQIPPI